MTSIVIVFNLCLVSFMCQLVSWVISTFQMLTNVAKHFISFWLAFYQHFSLMPYLKFTTNCNQLSTCTSAEITTDKVATLVFYE